MPPVDKDSTANADGLANVLLPNLVAGKEFSLPAVDLTSPEFNYDWDESGALFGEINKLSEADLTERKINGTGMFDGLMQALTLHLESQYKAGRITGSDYANAYIQLTNTAMGQAVSYLLTKEQSYWQAMLTQKQALAADIAASNARVALEVTRAQLGIAYFQMNQAEVDYAIGKMKLSNEDIQYAIGEAQLDNTKAQTDAQLYQNANTLPAQLAAILVQTETADFNLEYLMPKELDKANKAIEQSSAQISQIVAQKDQIIYQTANNLPATDANIRADTTLKDYQLTSILPATYSGLMADNAAKTYTNTYILPANLETILENNESNRAKTLDTRSDGVTPVAGLMGRQNDLYTQQVASYKRADEAKVAKMYLDTWVTQKSMDEGLTPPTSLTDSNINTVLTKLRNNIGMI